MSTFACSYRFFSPLGMAPVVGLVGLGLFQRGFPAVGATSKDLVKLSKRIIFIFY